MEFEVGKSYKLSDYVACECTGHKNMKNLGEKGTTKFKFLGKAKGDGVTHYIFQSNAGGWKISFTDLDFDIPGD